MKFIHKISKITSYIIQICLLIFILSSNSLWGEVIYEKEVIVTSHEDVSQIVNQSPFSTEAIKVFNDVGANKMPGCGVFIPYRKAFGALYRGAGKLYIAKKHAGPSTNLHDPKRKDSEENPGHPFNINFTDHTERQLALYLAAEAFAIPIKIQTDLRKLKEKIEELKIKQDVGKDVEGEFHIYTEGAPCTGDDDANNYFSCIKYYKILQQIFPKCKFHIYFKNPSIHPNADTSDVKNLINKIKNMLNESAIKIENYFKIENDRLKYNNSKDLKQAKWCEIEGDEKSPIAKQEFINTINRMLWPPTNYTNRLTVNQIEDIFNEVFVIKNFQYHLIR